MALPTLAGTRSILSVSFRPAAPAAAARRLLSSSGGGGGGGPLRPVALQLDYYLSAQFAGVAVAERQGLYAARGVRLALLPDCPVGEEARSVRARQDAHPEALAVGTVEQNVLVPVLAKDPSLKMTAVAAMFQESPLGLAALPGNAVLSEPQRAGLRVGAHEDTADLLRALLPAAEVVACHRDDKMGALRRGEIDAVQVYDLMETAMLAGEAAAAGRPAPAFVPLADLGAQLGYSQVIFAPTDALKDAAKIELLKDFLAATFDGWQLARALPAAAADDVEALMAARGVVADHWPAGDRAFTAETVAQCCERVVAAAGPAAAGPAAAGAVDPRRWAAAQAWLAAALPGARRAEGMPIFTQGVWP